MRKYSERRYYSIILRYLFLLIIGLPNLYLFYIFFTPLTIYSVYFLFSLFFETSLEGIVLIVENCFPIEIIKACIAGSAYYLLLILNLSIPNIKIKKRLKMISMSFAALLILNILRIFFLGLIFISGSNLFDITHNILWYFISIILVVAIWFSEVKFFKIKEIPFYSDLKFLYRKIK
jgi:exosortase/archaeosortase family protein